MTSNSSAFPGGNQFEKVGEFVAIYYREKSWYINYQHAGRQVRRSLKTPNKKVARRKALIIEKELLAGDHKQVKRAPLITAVVAEYLEHLTAEGRTPKTVNKYRFCYNLLQEIAESRHLTRISQIDVALVDRYRAERTAGAESRKPAKPKTVHNDTVTIRQLVNFARRRGLILEDPLRNLKIKKPKRTPQPCWTRAEVDLILAAAKAPFIAPLTFLAETGTRVGEAKWLTWEDVDFARRLIHIRPKEGWKPKSGDERVIPMSSKLVKLLSELPRAADWVFVARVTPRNPLPGRQISERRLLQYLKRVLKRLGLKGHLHTFRHAFISFAAYEGISERVLRKWIGHVDQQILDWYFHLADPDSQAAMDRLSLATERVKAEQITASISAQSQHNERSHKHDQCAS
jgi:integrase